MIKQYSSTLLLSGVALSFVGGSFLSAADRGQQRMPQQAPQPKQNPFKRYNDVAQKYYEAEPTADTVKEFKELLEKDKFFSIKKQCKTELDLLLEDIKAKVEVLNLAKQATQQLVQEFTQKPENRTNGAKIVVGKYPDMIEKAREKQKTTAKEKPESPLTFKEKMEQAFGTPGEGEEEIEEEIEEEAPTPKPIPAKPALVPGKGEIAPEAEAGTPNIPEKVVKQIVTTMMSAKPEPPLQAFTSLLSAPTPTKPKPEHLALAAAPTADEKATAPAFVEALAVVLEKPLEKIEATVKPEKIAAIIGNSATLMTQFSQEEVKATSSALQFMAAAVAEQGAPTAQEFIKPLIAQLDTTLAPKDMSKILQNNRVPVATAQQWSYTNLPSLIYSIGRDGELGNIENFATLIKNTNAMLQNAIATIKLVAPTVTTGLLIAPDEKTTEELDIKFRYLLQSFDALLDSVDLRALSTDKPFTSLSTALSNYTNSYAVSKFFTRNSNTTEGIVPQLMSITAYLSTTGTWFIKLIEAYIECFGNSMNAEFMKSYNEIDEKTNTGRYGIPQYENKDTFINHKYDYRDALIKKLQALEELLNKAINALSDEKQKEEYKKEVKKLGRQFRKSIGKKETAPGAKPKAPSRTKLPGTAQFTTGGRKTKPSGISPILEAKLAQAKEELKPVTPLPTILLPKSKPTALLPETDTDFENLKREITTLNEQTATSGQLSDLRKELSKFSKRSEYGKIQKILDDKEATINKRLSLERKTKSLNNVIEDIQAALESVSIVPSDTIGSWVSRFNIGSRGSTDEFKPLYTEFETKLRAYAKFLLKIISTSASLQASPTTFLETGTSEQLSKIARSAAALTELKQFMPAGAPSSIDNAVASLCATYDAILHALYTPAEFDPLLDRITVAENQTRSYVYINDLIATAKQAIVPLVEALDALLGETPEKGLMTKENGDKFRSGSLEITDIDQTLLVDDAYKYAVAQDTPVVIDAAANLSIPTLSALDATHRKEYEGMLTEWQERIQNNADIESFRKFDLKSLATLDPKKFETLMAQLEELKAKMPTLFETDATLKELFEQMKTVSENKDLADIIKALSDAIKLAQENFINAKQITLVEFETGYTEILGRIEDLPEEQNTFKDDIKKVVAQFSAYLTRIAQSLVATDLPERGYDAQAKLEATIKNIAQVPANFITMLNQLKKIDLLTDVKAADNPFATLYTTILQSYCYLLATFDALTANLFDGAHIQDPNLLQKFFAYATGTQTPNKYESAMAIVDKLLKPLEHTRSLYYQTLIEPFFVEETEIKSYLKGELNLANPDLGLKNLVEDKEYIYERTSKKATSKIPPITGLHIRNKEYEKNDIIHGGDKQYGNIIEIWENLIKKALPEEYKKQQLEQLAVKLDSILDTPFGDPINQDYMRGVEEILLTYLGISPYLLNTVAFLNTITRGYLNNKFLHKFLRRYKPEIAPVYRAYFNDMYSTERRSYSEENITNVYWYLKDAFDPRIDPLGITQPGTFSANYEATEQVKQIRSDNDIRSIAEFFITLKNKLSDPTILTELAAFEKKGLLTDEIRTRIYNICGSGFTILDSVIDWAYDTLNKYDETHHKEVGTLLGFFQPHIEPMIRSIMALTPYLPQKYLAEYQGDGLNLIPFAPPAGNNVYYYFFIGKIPSYWGGNIIKAVGDLITKGEIKLKDVKPEILLDLSFRQTGFHTEKTLNSSLKLLTNIIKMVGATIHAADATFDDLSPLNSMLDKILLSKETDTPYVPTPDEFEKMTTAMKPLFPKIKKRLEPTSASTEIKERLESTSAKELLTKITTTQPKITTTEQKQYTREAAEREQTIQLLQETGARLLFVYYAYFMKQEATSQQQKDAYKKLVALFTTTFGNVIEPDLDQYLQAIVQDTPLSAVQPATEKPTAKPPSSSSAKATADKPAPGGPATEKPTAKPKEGSPTAATKPQPESKPKVKPQPEVKPTTKPQSAVKPKPGQPSALEAFDILGGTPKTKPKGPLIKPTGLED